VRQAEVLVLLVMDDAGRDDVGREVRRSSPPNTRTSFPDCADSTLLQPLAALGDAQFVTPNTLALSPTPSFFIFRLPGLTTMIQSTQLAPRVATSTKWLAGLGSPQYWQLQHSCGAGVWLALLAAHGRCWLGQITKGAARSGRCGCTMARNALKTL
jgi:hypothetical protein